MAKEMKKEEVSKDLERLESAEFEERADYLESENLIKWTASSKHFNNIQKKITQVGAKLIVGPRGTGKTHQMRYAYFECQNDNSKPLAIYVSFNHYLRLETYLHENSNAIGIFHSWVLAKIIVSCTKDYNVSLNDFDYTVEDLEDFISDIERQKYSEEHNSLISCLTISETQSIIETTVADNKRKRAILLLDDAALTLTNDYMVEFFDIFRSLKSIKISPKASVYPGTTQYGPRFHVGQDAEKVLVWINVQDPEYITFMNSIVESRFNNQIEMDNSLKELFMYCAFGIPRTYIMFLRSFEDSQRKSNQSIFNSIIEEKSTNIIEEYNSISGKLPQYKNFISLGADLLSAIIGQLKEHNYNKKDTKRNLIIGISEIDDKAERIFKFLIEAGILFELDPISHGQDRKLRRFVPHISLLMKEKALLKSKGFKASDFLEILTSGQEKHPVRRKFNKLIAQPIIDSLCLDLPPCSNCQTPRIAEGQKFCHICGAELVEGSVFKNCMSKALDSLPLTRFQKRVISQTKYKIVQDVISADDTAAELKKVKGVGPVHSTRIINKINEWTNEFLY